MSKATNNNTTPKTSESIPQRGNPFRNPTVIASLITAIATICAAIAGSLITIRTIQESEKFTYDLTVSSTKYPFEDTSIEIYEGDEIELVVLSAESVILDCGIEQTTVMGMLNEVDQYQTILPTSNLCSLIGRIGPESAPHFYVGAYSKFIAQIDGKLSLGINDVPPEKCSMPDCYSDNTGKVFVRVTIRK